MKEGDLDFGKRLANRRRQLLEDETQQRVFERVNPTAAEAEINAAVTRTAIERIEADPDYRAYQDDRDRALAEAEAVADSATVAARAAEEALAEAEAVADSATAAREAATKSAAEARAALSAAESRLEQVQRGD